MEVRSVPIDLLQPADYNPRKKLKPGDAEYERLKKSIQEFGYVELIVWNETTGHVVAGHQRADVLRDLGYVEVEVRVIHVSLEQEKILNVGLNKIGSEFDETALATLMDDILLTTQDESYLELTGFSVEQIDKMVENLVQEDGDCMPDDEKPDKYDRVKKNPLAYDLDIEPSAFLDGRGSGWKKRRTAWKRLGIQGIIQYDAAALVIKERGPVANFDPVLAEAVYYWFAVPGFAVYDPFAHNSCRGIVAGISGMKYTGQTANDNQAEENAEQWRYAIAKMKKQPEIMRFAPVVPEWAAAEADGKYDLIFGCPNYDDADELAITLPADHKITYKAFLTQFKNTVAAAIGKLKENRFMVLVVGEVQAADGTLHGFVGDVVQIGKKAGLNYYGEAFFIPPAAALPDRIDSDFFKRRQVPNGHQHILIFFKGDVAKIKKNYPMLG